MDFSRGLIAVWYADWSLGGVTKQPEVRVRLPPLLSYLILAHSPPGCSLTPCCSLDIQVETRANLFPLCRYAGVWVGVRHWNYDWLPRNRPLALPLITTHLLLTQWYIPPTPHSCFVGWPSMKAKSWWMGSHLICRPRNAHQGIVMRGYLDKPRLQWYTYELQSLKMLFFFLSYPNPNLQILLLGVFWLFSFRLVTIK